MRIPGALLRSAVGAAAALLLFAGVGFLALRCGPAEETEPSVSAADLPDPTGWRVLRSIPWDSTAWTQGLVVDPGGRTMTVSTGIADEGLVAGTDRAALSRSSRVYRIDLDTGRVLSSVLTGSGRFGEGLARTDRGTVWQLLWTDALAAVERDAQTLAPTGRRLSRAGYGGDEGWGLCSWSDHSWSPDGGSPVMAATNGSPEVVIRDQENLKVVDRVRVDVPGARLNGLACQESGRVWANVFQTNLVLDIDATTGATIRSLDLTRLVSEQTDQNPEANILNGLTTVPGHPEQLWVTGKLWDQAYLLEVG